jgi:hypothetical protein
MFVLTLALMLVRPLIVGPTPHRPVKRAEALVYSERALGFTVLLILSVVGAGYGSISLVRIAKEEYRRLAAENMQAMIEGALRDQARQAEKDHEQAT